MNGLLDERQFIARAEAEASRRAAALTRDLRRPDGSLDEYTSHKPLRELLWTLLPDPAADGILLLPSKNAVLLTGAPGCGKRSLACTFLDWASQAGFRCFSVDRSLASSVPEDSLPEFLAKLMSGAETAPLAVVIEAGSGEGTERRCPDPLLAAAAGAWKQVPDRSCLTVILVSSDPFAVQDADLPGLIVLPAGLPAKKEREDFFAEHRNRMPRRNEPAAAGAAPVKAPSFAWLAEKTEGLSYSGLQQVVRIVRMRLKLRAMQEFGSSVEVREAADPAEREAAMKNLFINGLAGGSFWYSEDMFLDAVRLVRETENAYPQSAYPIKGFSYASGNETYSGVPGEHARGTMSGGSRFSGDALSADLFRDAEDMPGRSSEIGSSAAKIRAVSADADEDELAFQDLMAGLDLPPDPRKK